MSNKPPKFFSWNPVSSLGGDFEFHETSEKARSAALSALEDLLDGDSFELHDAEGICWGEIRETVVLSKTHEHGKGTPCWDSGFNDEESSCSEGYPLEWDYAVSGKLETVQTDEEDSKEG